MPGRAVFSEIFKQINCFIIFHAKSKFGFEVKIPQQPKSLPIFSNIKLHKKKSSIPYEICWMGILAANLNVCMQRDANPFLLKYKHQ